MYQALNILWSVLSTVWGSRPFRLQHSTLYYTKQFAQSNEFWTSFMKTSIELLLLQASIWFDKKYSGERAAVLLLMLFVLELAKAWIFFN